MSDVRRPIGVFDSGVGGLTVLSALRDRLPDESTIYLGDNARTPYGPSSPSSTSPAPMSTTRSRGPGEMAPSERVVLDTNIALSALVFTGEPLARIRSAWRSGEITPLASATTIAELIGALTYPKFALSAPEQRELLGDYLPMCESVVTRGPLDHLPRCRDPDDQIFLELAEAGNARWLVTGDRDLLALQGQMRCEIITAAVFVQEYLERSG